MSVRYSCCFEGDLRCLSQAIKVICVHPRAVLGKSALDRCVKMQAAARFRVPSVEERRSWGAEGFFILPVKWESVLEGEKEAE